MNYVSLLSRILDDEYKFILMVADDESHAAEMVGKLKGYLLASRLGCSYGADGLLKDAPSDFIACMGDKMFRVLAVSYGTKMNGLHWRNYRPDLIVLNSARDLNAGAYREWVDKNLLPCGSRDGAVLVIH
jgi:hypothetical protein